MIKILGLLKSFSFLIGAFMVPYFKNGKTEQMKGHFSNTRCPKKSTWPYFGKKKRYKDMIKVFGTMKSFAFLNWYICVAFSKKMDVPG